MRTGGCSQELIGIGNACSCRCTVYHNGKAKVMVVDSVHTVEAYRRQGLAARLMFLVEERAKALGVDCIELVVNRDNMDARKLYAKADFEETDKVYMRKILNKWKT